MEDARGAIHSAAAAVAGLAIAFLAGFAAVQGESPRGFALPVLVLVLLVAAGAWWRTRPGRDRATLEFADVEVGESRWVREGNVFNHDWKGVPVVFSLVNPRGNARARAIRPTVTVRDPEGVVLAGPTNARWSNPQSPRNEEVERDIPSNDAPVGVDTVIQPVGGDKFWLVTDENLRLGLKATTAIEAADFQVTVSVKGENVVEMSHTVRVRLGFPNPWLGDEEPVDTMLPPTPPEPEPEPTVEPAPDPDPEPDPRDESAAADQAPPSPRPRPRLKSPGLMGELEVKRDEGYKLLSALKGGAVTIWQYDRAPTADDVESWTVNVEHLLRDDTKLLYLFKYKPLAPRAIASVQDLVAAMLGRNAAAAADLERLLVQLDKVIEAI
jgi:hypothetical protein